MEVPPTQKMAGAPVALWKTLNMFCEKPLVKLRKLDDSVANPRKHWSATWLASSGISLGTVTLNALFEQPWPNTVLGEATMTKDEPSFSLGSG